MHKCDKCKHKSEHVEMGFRSVGVCTREPNILKAVLFYNSPTCPYGDADGAVQILQNAIKEASNAYATHLMFGGKADQGEEDWMGIC